MQRPTIALGLACALAALGASPLPLARAEPRVAAQAPVAPARVAEERPYRHAAPTELFEITRVVDGDTIWIRRGAAEEKLRLHCVDTEEKLSGRSTDPGKPETSYGQSTALWAQEFFARLGSEGKPARIGLCLPGGREQRDVYGRLLAHVLLPDGTDFNVLLVRQGRSPYFNKYGNSVLCDAAFRQAQERARSESLGIWNAATNAATTPGAPSARRDYERLQAWWDARATAIDAFRARAAQADAGVFDAEDPRELERALAWQKPPERTAEMFGCIEGTFDEDSGDLTVLFRGTDKKAQLRARVPQAARAALAALELPTRGESYRQNYLFVRGTLARSPRGGVELVAASPEQWRVAGPEPAPEAAAEPAAVPAGAR